MSSITDDSLIWRVSHHFKMLHPTSMPLSLVRIQIGPRGCRVLLLLMTQSTSSPFKNHKLSLITCRLSPKRWGVIGVRARGGGIVQQEEPRLQPSQRRQFTSQSYCQVLDLDHVITLQASVPHLEYGHGHHIVLKDCSKNWNGHKQNNQLSVVAL